jgi:hypothetical protein
MITESAVQKFRESLRGQSLCPGEQGYDAARNGPEVSLWGIATSRSTWLCCRITGHLKTTCPVARYTSKWASGVDNDVRA